MAVIPAIEELFMRRVTIVLLLVLCTGVLGTWGVVEYRRWRRFVVVEPGVLYRSNLLSNDDLAYVLDKHRIKTVFSLSFTRCDEVQAVCDRKGVQRYFHYLPGNGAGPDEPYLRFLEVIQNPANHPVLVHCSAGVQRTGGAVALFRIIEQGWTFDRAIAEMKWRGNDGNKLQMDQLTHLVQRLLPPSQVAANATTDPR
jgi:tyrosine-protein phosphatase SIW14